MLAEEIADLVAPHVHAGKYEVVGRLAAQLLDEFTQIALDDAVAIVLHGRVEMDLFARHALALDDGAGLGISQEREHDRAGLVGIPGPVHDTAVGLEGGHEPGKEFVEPVDGRPLGEAGRVAGLLPVAVAGFLGIAARVVAAEGLADECTMAGVANVLGRVVQEPLFRPAVGAGGFGRGGGNALRAHTTDLFPT